MNRIKIIAVHEYEHPKRMKKQLRALALFINHNNNLANDMSPLKV